MASGKLKRTYSLTNNESTVSLDTDKETRTADSSLADEDLLNEIDNEADSSDEEFDSDNSSDEEGIEPTGKKQSGSDDEEEESDEEDKVSDDEEVDSDNSSDEEGIEPAGEEQSGSDHEEEESDEEDEEDVSDGEEDDSGGDEEDGSDSEESEGKSEAGNINGHGIKISNSSVEEEKKLGDDSQKINNLKTKKITLKDKVKNQKINNENLLKKITPKKNAKNQKINNGDIEKKRNISKEKAKNVKDDVKVDHLSKINEKKRKTKADVLLEKNSLIKEKKQISNSTNKDKLDEIDEYEDGDTSDEEDIRNTIGNVPVNWYDDYKHIGYDWDGNRILKPDHEDEIDYFLRRMEDPNFWRTVRDPKTGQNVILSENDVNLIQRLEKQKIPDEAYDEYAPWIEWFSSEVMEMPLRKFPAHKRSFIPSKDEKRKVAKMVHAIKMGWMKTSKQIREEKKKKEEEGLQFYMLWQGDDVAEEMRRIHQPISAPKGSLPGHAESYNPPEEYLFTDKDMQKLETSKFGNKKLHFVPKKYDSLRNVPSYDKFLDERFNRCLDLYLCPRAVKMKLMIEPEDLLPKLPNPKDLQPFPTMQALVFEGHTDMIRTMSLDPLGQYLVSGSDDCTIKFWELNTGRCLKTVPVSGVVECVRWCPNQALSLVAVATGNKCFIINPGLGDSLIVSKTNTLLKEPPPQDGIIPDRVKACIQWHWEEDLEETFRSDGVLLIINHFKEIKQVTWHGKGDYFATVMPDGANRSVIIHQLSKGKSQIPFSKSKGQIQCVIFHPIRPFFFVATQKNVRLYDLVKQQMVKKLYSNTKWISSMAIHPGGDNLLLSSYDSKVVWLDLDLSTKPYKVLRLHSTAVRSVAFHRRYPLFASVSDDCTLIVCHGMVYNDLVQNALIVPLKRLSNHKNNNDYGIFEVMFHHTQPWVLTCGADKTIRLYS